MPLSNVPKWRALGALLLCLLSSITAVCGTKEVTGLDIQKITASLYSPGSIYLIPSVKHLDELSAYAYFPRVQSCKVTVSFEENNGDNLESSSDTDEEGWRENDKEGENSEWISFALNTPPTESDSKRGYLLRENELNVEEEFTHNLCEKLARDACHIANAHTSAITRNLTTCLCVVLRDTDGRAKKFVFHNGKDKMNTTMAQKAKALKYAIRTGYQAHAEAAFIQFLLQREQQNSERYTHILGMGCSRRHCQECDYLMKLSLGKHYHSFTAAMCEEALLPVVTNVEDGCDIRPKEHAALVHENYAVKTDGRRSDRYYLPKVLKEYICQKVALALDFSSDRFSIKNEETAIARRQRSDKKRKATSASSSS